MKQKYDEEGCFRLVAAVLEQTKSDYILGKVTMYRKLRKFYDEDEWNVTYRKRVGTESQRRIDLYFQSKRFIEKDPYGIIDNLGGKKTIFTYWDTKVAELIDSGKELTKSTYASRLKSL